MPEDIIDFEPIALEPEARPAETVADTTPAPVPLTREDLNSFGQTLAREIAAALKPATTTPNQVDWERQFADQAANAATARLMETNKPLFAATIAEQVAGQFGPEIKREIVETLQKLPGHVVANLPHSPEDLKRLGHLARGMHAERQAAQAPRSNGAGTMNPAGAAEAELAAKFWGDYRDVPGFTKEMAREMAKDSLQEK